MLTMAGDVGDEDPCDSAHAAGGNIENVATSRLAVVRSGVDLDDQSRHSDRAVQPLVAAPYFHAREGAHR